MTKQDGLTVEGVLVAFDEYLQRVRGLCAGTRHNYARYVGEFMAARFGADAVKFDALRAVEVTAFVAGSSERYSPRTVEHVATALRSLFRFAQTQGWVGKQMVEAVPMVPHRPSGLVRHLDPGVLEELLASLARVTQRDLRDRAFILMIARLGLRPGEVRRLRLEDLDWVNAVLRVCSRKTGHGALLPLTHEVGAAVVEYLRNGRPKTDAREVFVLHQRRVGAPISTNVVGRAVQRAVDNSGIAAPSGGGNLLRHSLATQLLSGGVGLGQIADLLGHSSLATTRIYAAVDIGRLGEVAMPWPQAGARS